MTIQATGMIMKQTGGFYYVETPAGERIECRAKGIFRKDDRRPVVGDRVTVEIDPSTGRGMVAAYEPRMSYLVRPPLANLDQLFLVSALRDPAPNLFVLDKLIAIAEYKHIEPVIVLSKCDLGDPEPLRAIYERAGFAVISVCAGSGEGIEAVRARLAGRLSAFTGNTGVGKSTLLNALDPTLAIETGEISRKLGRGRHTTRHVELYHLAGGLIADTPGFSTVQVIEYEPILKEELQYCFRDLSGTSPTAVSTGCAHVKEKGCAVLEAVEAGEIAKSRHQSYCELYEEAKELREWELNRE